MILIIANYAVDYNVIHGEITTGSVYDGRITFLYSTLQTIRRIQTTTDYIGIEVLIMFWNDLSYA